MPGPNNPTPLTSEQLSEMLDAVASAGSDAVDSLAEYEAAPPPKANGDVCHDLETTRQRLQDMIEGINATMADLGCGA